MKARGCVDAVVPWSDARRFFHWRLRVRQRVESIKEELVRLSKGRLSLDDAHHQVYQVIPGTMVDNDEMLARWLENNPQAFTALLDAARKM